MVRERGEKGTFRMQKKKKKNPPADVTGRKEIPTIRERASPSLRKTVEGAAAQGWENSSPSPGPGKLLTAGKSRAPPASGRKKVSYRKPQKKKKKQPLLGGKSAPPRPKNRERNESVRMLMKKFLSRRDISRARHNIGKGFRDAKKKEASYLHKGKRSGSETGGKELIATRRFSAMGTRAPEGCCWRGHLYQRGRESPSFLRESAAEKKRGLSRSAYTNRADDPMPQKGNYSYEASTNVDWPCCIQPKGESIS